ncbi:hypothetical protein N2152v2_005612 [Parachlorella kessleri]
MLQVRTTDLQRVALLLVLGLSCATANGTGQWDHPILAWWKNYQAAKQQAAAVQVVYTYPASASPTPSPPSFAPTVTYAPAAQLSSAEALWAQAIKRPASPSPSPSPSPPLPTAAGPIYTTVPAAQTAAPVGSPVFVSSVDNAITLRSPYMMTASLTDNGIDVIARAMSNAILSGKGAQLVPLIADAAGYPGVLSAWASALDYTLPQSTANPSGLIDALAAARGTSTVTDPRALPPLANATFNALRDAIIGGQGPTILELVDPSAPLSPTNRAVLSTLATSLARSICQSPGASAPTIATAVASSNATAPSLKATAAAKAVASVLDICCAQAAQAVAAAAASSGQDFPAKFAAAFAATNATAIPVCFQSAVPQAVSAAINQAIGASATSKSADVGAP